MKCEMCGASADFEIRTTMVAISQEGERVLSGAKSHDNYTSACASCVMRLGMAVSKNMLSTPKEAPS